MSGPLAALRASLAAALVGKVTVDGTPLDVVDLLPDTMSPPALLIEPDDPFLTSSPDLPSRVMVAHFTVLAITGRGTNPTQVLGVEALTEQILDAVCDPSHDWVVDSSSGPRAITWADTTFVGVRVAVSQPVQITSS